VPQAIQDDLAALGPFFAVRWHPPGAAPGPPWLALGDLAGQPGPLLRRIGSARAALADRAGRPEEQIEPRVAASVTQLGLAARVIAPAVAAAAAGHRLDLPPGGLWWQDTLGGPVPLSVPEPGRPPTAPGAAPGTAPGSPAGPECLRVLDEVVAPLTEAVAALVPVSPRVLWGNVASAVNSAAVQVAAGRPDLSDRAWAVATAFLASPRLGREAQRPGPAFRRSSCCLIYKIAPGQASGVCGDCVLSGARISRRGPGPAGNRRRGRSG
jgi:FhuF 2Fe-2S C-terminal domain/Ferric iron reductase FhuF-like transporter